MGPCILCVAVWKQLHMICSTGADDDLTTESHVDASTLFLALIFRWLTHVLTLYDP
jgi:hypothetical protein